MDSKILTDFDAFSNRVKEIANTELAIYKSYKDAGYQNVHFYVSAMQLDIVSMFSSPKSFEVIRKLLSEPTGFEINTRYKHYWVRLTMEFGEGFMDRLVARAISAIRATNEFSEDVEKVFENMPYMVLLLLIIHEFKINYKL